MKRLTSTIAILCTICMMASCTKGFDKIQKDPEGLYNTSAGYFLNEILFDGANTGLNRALVVNNELTQVTVSEVETVELHRYIIRTNVADYAWNSYYPILQNIKDMRFAAKRDKEVNSEAISLVLWAWIYQNLTDIYGDIPYETALNGYPDFKLRNKFDEQSHIYQDLVNKLDTANNMFNTSLKLEQGGDLMYGSDAVPANMLLWKKFGNSLRLRLLMRIAHKSPEARSQINLILSNATKYPVMTSVAESAAVRYSKDAPFINPYNTARQIDFNGFKAISKFFLDNLISWNDPRIAKWCKPILGGVQVGLPSGFTREQQAIATLSYSTLVDTLKESSLLGSILQYSEVEFIRAEAILKGYTTGDAKTAYENGIKASLGYWGVSVPSDFLTRPGVVYDGTLKQVYLQKYYALFFNDMQQWFEIRRTGYPVLPKGDATIGKEIPSRLTYPLLIQSANAENYHDAVNNMGGDNINTKVWWQKP